MTTKHDAMMDQLSLLEACTDADALAAWAADLYETGLLDESEQCGALAPWTPPLSAEVIDERGGEDITVRLSNGNGARWVNTERTWRECTIYRCTGCGGYCAPRDDEWDSDSPMCPGCAADVRDDND